MVSLTGTCTYGSLQNKRKKLRYEKQQKWGDFDKRKNYLYNGMVDMYGGLNKVKDKGENNISRILESIKSDCMIWKVAGSNLY